MSWKKIYKTPNYGYFHGNIMYYVAIWKSSHRGYDTYWIFEAQEPNKVEQNAIWIGTLPKIEYLQKLGNLVDVKA